MAHKNKTRKVLVRVIDFKLSSVDTSKKTAVLYLKSKQIEPGIVLRFKIDRFALNLFTDALLNRKKK